MWHLGNTHFQENPGIFEHSWSETEQFHTTVTFLTNNLVPDTLSQNLLYVCGIFTIFFFFFLPFYNAFQNISL